MHISFVLYLNSLCYNIVQGDFKNEKVLIYTSIGVALAIILFFVGAFFGNPVSRVLANKAANDYLKTHYTDLEPEKESAFYNFKDAKYVVRLQDKNSPDSQFRAHF